MPESVNFSQNKKNSNLFDIKMTITKGKVLALLSAVEHWDTPVGVDLYQMLKEATKDFKN